MTRANRSATFPPLVSPFPIPVAGATASVLNRNRCDRPATTLRQFHKGDVNEDKVLDDKEREELFKLLREEYVVERRRRGR